MTDFSITRPDPAEYAHYYARYIDSVPSGHIIRRLQGQMAETLDLIAGLTEKESLRRYAPEKWSIKEVLGHIIDCERICAYRALRFGRNDKCSLAGFRQDDYVREAGFDRIPLKGMAKAYQHVREATVDLFESLKAEDWQKTGIANELAVSVRSLAWIISGHEQHHKKVILTRYLHVENI